MQDEKTYCVLNHKRHKRKVYFQNTEKAIKFLKVRFDPSLRKFRKIKKIIYFLIKMKALQPFLKKIRLPTEFGDVVFIANQTKCFDLDKGIVTSFPLKEKKEEFIKSKELQKELGEKGFAPKILGIDYDTPSSKEELLKPYEGDNDIGVFKKLFSFYKSQGIGGEITTIHGSFRKEQVLIKGDSYVFTDWDNIRKGHIFTDLINFYEMKLRDEK